VRQFRPELPPQVSALVAKMLAKRPAQRHQSAAELIAELIVLGQQLDLPRLAQRGQLWVPVPVAVPWWRQAPVQVLAAAGVLALLILLHEWFLAPASHGTGRETPGPLQFVPTASSGAEPVSDAHDSASPAQTSHAPPGVPAPASLPGDPRSTARSELESAPDTTPGPRPLLPSSDDLPPRRQPTESPPAGPGEPNIVTGLLPPEPADVPSRPRRLVVSLLPQPPEPASEQVRSLPEALAKAAEWGLGEIELRVDGPLLCPPLDVALPRLVVRAAPGFRPVLLFQPTVDVPQRVMLQLTGGTTHLTLEGIELHLDLPDDAPADGWALLGMSTGQSLELSDAVLTIDNGPRPQQPLHDQVAMVVVQRRRPLDGMGSMDPLLAMGQQARLVLKHVFARGEASLANLVEETPLTFSCSQSLLLCGQHLVRTSGSVTSPKYYDQIVIDLTHVTAYARQGLYYLRRGPGKGHQFRVNFYARECIFVTEPDRPLFEMVGVSELPEEDELVAIGEGNRYSPQDVVFLRLHSGLPGETLQDFELGKRWSTETRSQAGVLWQRSPPWHQPLHTLSKDDFWVDPSLGRAGCDPQVLPVPWSSASSAATAPSPATPTSDRP
jgi:serine/threonine-protein kinase